MLTSSALSLFLLAIALPLPTIAAQDVHVVDANNGPGTEYTTIGAAVLAAASGDIVLVRSGLYEFAGSSIGRSVSIVVDAAADVTMQNVSAMNFAAGEYLVLQGAKINGSFPSTKIASNEGPIWFQDVNTSAGPFFQFFVGGGVDVVGTTSLVFQDCNVGAPLAVPGVTTMPDSLTVVGSNVRLASSLSQGLSQPKAGTAGTAVTLSSASLQLWDSTIWGLDGMIGNILDCPGTAGGNGIGADASSEILMLGSSVTGGAGGPGFGGCAPGPAGFAFALNGASLTTLPDTARTYDAPSPLREGAPLPLTFDGVAGDRVWLLVSSSPAPAYATPLATGELYLSLPISVLPMGTIAAAGTLTLNATAPNVSAGSEGGMYFTQCLVREAASGRFFLGSTQVVCILATGL